MTYHQEVVYALDFFLYLLIECLHYQCSLKFTIVIDYIHGRARVKNVIKLIELSNILVYTNLF